MFISHVRINNFRCLKNLSFHASPTTVLIGENNTGKSAVLECLNTILGQLRTPRFEPTDLHTTVSDVPEEHREPIEVELEYQPSQGKTFTKEEHEVFLKQFDFDEDGCERLRIVTTYTYDISSHEFVFQSHFQKKDGPGDRFSARYARSIPFYLAGALRDLGREMGTRGGFWGRLMSTVELSQDSKVRVKQLLSDINAEMRKDEKLHAIQSRLKAMLESVMNLQTSEEGVVISPLAQETTEIVRRSAIYLKSPGAEVYFPLTSYGMGSQSVGVLALFRTYVETLGLGNAILGIEEPEAHLHPHLQRFLYGELNALANQVFLTTHSTFITDKADLHDIVLLKRRGPETEARQIPHTSPSGQPFLTEMERRNLQNFINAENSEMFFAKCVILAEGKSEKLVLPTFSRAMGINLDQLGVSVLPVEGKNFSPFLKILSSQALDVNRIVVCDGDAAKSLANTLESLQIIPKGTVKKALQKKSLLKDVLAPQNCFAIGDIDKRENLESFLLSQGFAPEFEQAISDLDGPHSLKEYIKQREATQKGQGKPANYSTIGREQQILDFIDKAKPRYAERVAELITQGGVKCERIPRVFQKLLRKAEAVGLAAARG